MMRLNNHGKIKMNQKVGISLISKVLGIRIRNLVKIKNLKIKVKLIRLKRFNKVKLKQVGEIKKHKKMTKQIKITVGSKVITYRPNNRITIL